MGLESPDLNSYPPPCVESVDPTTWSLATPSPSSFSPSAATFPATVIENPTSELQCTLSLPAGDPSNYMAYERADPRPFVPRTLVWQDVVNRPTMVRVVASRRATPKNEDLAIVTIAPLPGNVLDFEVVEEVLREFFDARRIMVSNIPPCSLGKAYVRFLRALVSVFRTTD